ncbi:MAG: hypothetical protein ACMUIS_04760 [bacterium]
MQNLSPGKGDRRAPENNRSPGLTPARRPETNTRRSFPIPSLRTPIPWVGCSLIQTFHLFITTIPPPAPFSRSFPITGLHTSTRSGRYTCIPPFQPAKCPDRCILIITFRSPQNPDRRLLAPIVYTSAPFGRHNPIPSLRTRIPSDRRTLTPHDLPEMRI